MFRFESEVVRSLRSLVFTIFIDSPMILTLLTFIKASSSSIFSLVMQIINNVVIKSLHKAIIEVQVEVSASEPQSDTMTELI